MKKELKDYLHLYLGCEAAIEYDPKGIAGMHIDKIVGVYEFGATVSNGYMEDFKNIKPILRPLSSMTEEEFIEVAKIHISQGGKIEITLDTVKKQLSYFPETFRYLLSKHFDLFGLTEAGLAIDKTKM